MLNPNLRASLKRPPTHLAPGFVCVRLQPTRRKDPNKAECGGDKPPAVGGESGPRQARLRNLDEAIAVLRTVPATGFRAKLVLGIRGR